MDETKTSKAQMESPCISGQAKRQATVRVRNRVDMRGGSEAELSRRPVDAGEQSTSTTAPSTAKHESTEEKTNERRGGEEREKEKKRGSEESQRGAGWLCWEVWQTSALLSGRKQA